MILSPSNPFPISFVVGERIQGPQRPLSASCLASILKHGRYFVEQTQSSWQWCSSKPILIRNAPHYPHYKPTGIVKRILIKSVFLSSGWVFWQSYTCNSDLNGLTNMATSGQRDSPGLPTPQKYYRDLALMDCSQCLRKVLIRSYAEKVSFIRVKYAAWLLMLSSVSVEPWECDWQLSSHHVKWVNTINNHPAPPPHTRHPRRGQDQVGHLTGLSQWFYNQRTAVTKPFQCWIVSMMDKQEEIC